MKIMLNPFCYFFTFTGMRKLQENNNYYPKTYLFNLPVFFAFVKNGLDSAFVRSKMKINDSKRRKG